MFGVKYIQLWRLNGLRKSVFNEKKNATIAGLLSGDLSLMMILAFSTISSSPLGVGLGHRYGYNISTYMDLHQRTPELIYKY